MAATAAATDIGFATTFGKVVANVYTALAEVTELSPPELSRDSVDFTHFGSPDRHREFKPGLSDAGEVALEAVAALLEVVDTDVGYGGRVGRGGRCRCSP